MKKPCYIAGMMSGTSGDGVDAALVKFDQNGSTELVEHHFLPYPQSTTDAIFELATANELEPTKVASLDDVLAQHYQHATEQLVSLSNVSLHDVEAIANHGQTIKHAPNETPPWSLQLGDSQALANKTKLSVISQFRQKDLALGGQGAPLMPAFHRHLVCSKSEYKNKVCAVVNIGGIANVSLVHENSQQTVGFDSGPGNTLLDQWIKKHQGLNFDKNGAWASNGQVNRTLLALLLSDPYFKKPFPKSTGPDYFNLAWLEAHLANLGETLISPVDIQATLVELSATSIHQAITLNTQSIDQVFVCGGGWHNDLLIQRLESLSKRKIHSTELLGAHPDWMEAMGFAWLGYCFLENIPSNLPSVTGAREPAVLGEIFYPKS
jgi:anhydro-N-acetylmuramic acid kinase